MVEIQPPRTLPSLSFHSQVPQVWGPIKGSIPDDHPFIRPLAEFSPFFYPLSSARWGKSFRQEFEEGGGNQYAPAIPVEVACRIRSGDPELHGGTRIDLKIVEGAFHLCPIGSDGGGIHGFIGVPDSKRNAAGRKYVVGSCIGVLLYIEGETITPGG